MRVAMHTSYVNRRKVEVIEEQVLPWEVDGQLNFTDII
jgi:hypothetical protein